MRQRLRRAGGFAAVSTLALAAPALGRAAAAPFVAVALLAAFVIEDGELFELFARPGDRRDGRLNGLVAFSLAATALAVLASVPRTPMPLHAFAVGILTPAYGNLGREFVRIRTTDDFLMVTGFAATGFVAGVLGQLAVTSVSGDPTLSGLPIFAFLAATGALVAALLRSVLFERDDPLVILSVGFLLWGFSTLVTTVDPVLVASGLGVTLFLGWISYALETASATGMLTGVLLGLLTIVLGGLGWFAVLIAFFAIGGLSTKFRYDEKKRRGVAEDNEGARGGGNVLGNAAIALAAVIGYAAAGQFAPGLRPPVSGAPALPSLVAAAFAGSIATAMADTLSSEIGGLFDDPRLITTLEPVEPGTDGAVTLQGEIAGMAGAALIAVIAAGVLPLGLSVPGATAVVTVGGVFGMTVDSLLGATVEGGRLGNQSINFLATLAGAACGTALALVLPLV